MSSRTWMYRKNQREHAARPVEFLDELTEPGGLIDVRWPVQRHHAVFSRRQLAALPGVQCLDDVIRYPGYST